jgi:hypothetical protein
VLDVLFADYAAKGLIDVIDEIVICAQTRRRDGYTDSQTRMPEGESLSGMNPAVLRQQTGHSSAVMTARYTGEIPLDKVQEAFSKMELENEGVIGKRTHCTGSHLVVYNQ